MPAGPGPEWMEPGPELAAPGIHRIPLPMPQDGLRAVNVYAIENGEGALTLIDGGWAVAQARTELEKAIDQLGYALADISQILVTHAHRDHYTLAVQLRRELGIPIGLGSGERPTIDAILRPRGIRFAAQVALLREAGAADLAGRIAAQDDAVDALSEGWEEPDAWIEAGRLPVAGRELRVIPTPGHTRGHIVFADEAAGLLFAGDHVLPHITPSLGFEAAPSPSPLRDYLDSLALIRALPDLRLLPAHGWVTASAHERVDELVAHHDERLREMTEAVASLAPASAGQVAAAIGWTRRRRPFTVLDPFNQMLAITETIAHLRLLVTAGSLLASPDEVVLYQVADARI